MLRKLGLVFCRSEVILPWFWRKAEFHLGAHKKIDLLPTDESFLLLSPLSESVRDVTQQWECGIYRDQ